MQASRWIGVAPWEWGDRPAKWLKWTLEAMDVTEEVASIRKQRQS